MSPPSDPSSYVSVKLTPAARADLRDGAVRMTSPARRQLSLSEVLVAALAVARNHEDEWAQALRRTS